MHDARYTGLKIKGDGLKFPTDKYNRDFRWGECDECQYWPQVIQPMKGLKACIFDNDVRIPQPPDVMTQPR